MAEPMTCYRHPERRAGVRCQRCEQPICPDCMRQASVGFHCPVCAKQGAQKVLRARDLAPTGPISRLLIAVNVGVFLLDVASGGTLLDGTGRVWADGVLVAPIIHYGGEWWRIITAGFLHYGAFHLAMNMYALWILGPQLEHAVGPRWFVSTYAVALIAGSFGALLLDPLAATAGASGAIYGLLGLAVVLQRARGIDPWASGVATVLLLNLALTFTIPGISIGGHLGGLIGGALVGWCYVEIGARLGRSREAFALALALGCLAMGGAIWAAGAMPTVG